MAESVRSSAYITERDGAGHHRFVNKIDSRQRVATQIRYLGDQSLRQELTGIACLLISGYGFDDSRRSNQHFIANRKSAQADAKVLADDTPDSGCESPRPYPPAKNQVASGDPG